MILWIFKFSQYKLPHAICRFETINSIHLGSLCGVVVSYFLNKYYHFYFISSSSFFIWYPLSSVHFILIYFVCASDKTNHAHFGECDINNLANENMNAQHFLTRSQLLLLLLRIFAFFCFSYFWNSDKQHSFSILNYYVFLFYHLLIHNVFPRFYNKYFVDYHQQYLFTSSDISC